ncbi:hypothetical protein G1H11_18595 [Phytoactinopolyspora alkaliphila]|uniref:3-hydroxyacyl-CoA dehydrogenase n=1 Tax=Phytoactinopolyspora alkaliphila TaxID=1783498 RepID=A0A6N9YQI4_9ACTN|nr:Rv3235 family protein [Phytoactinopolyspora alkaliphila]NED97311.1 hypothetical protein [Phytoactinopolyspora alkaliphila]
MPRHLSPSKGPRRLPVPPQNPPFDDELGITPQRAPAPPTGGATEHALQGTLPLSVTTSRRSARTRPGRPGAAGPPGGRATGPAEPQHWCARFAVWAVEALYGQRALSQLLRWTSSDVYASLSERAVRRRVSAAATPSVRSLRVCDVRPQVFEAAVVIQEGPRARALAMRFEMRDRRWLCTALDLV